MSESECVHHSNRSHLALGPAYRRRHESAGPEAALSVAVADLGHSLGGGQPGRATDYEVAGRGQRDCTAGERAKPVVYRSGRGRAGEAAFDSRRWTGRCDAGRVEMRAGTLTRALIELEPFVFCFSRPVLLSLFTAPREY